MKCYPEWPNCFIPNSKLHFKKINSVLSLKAYQLKLPYKIDQIFFASIKKTPGFIIRIIYFLIYIAYIALFHFIKRMQKNSPPRQMLHNAVISEKNRGIISLFAYL